MKKCPYCNADVEDVFSYCTSCGAQLGCADSVGIPAYTESKNYKKQGGEKTYIIVAGIFAVILLIFLCSRLNTSANDPKVLNGIAQNSQENNLSQNEVVSQENVSENKSYSPTADDADSKNSSIENVQYQINGTRVNMREYPSLSAQVIYQFPGYEYVKVTDKTTAESGKYPWYRVSYNGYVGWVYGQFVK